MRKVCLIISFFLVLTLLPLGSNVFASGNNEVSSSVNIDVPPSDKISDGFKRSDYVWDFNVPEGFNDIKNNMRVTMNNYSIPFPSLEEGHHYRIGYEFSINSSLTYWGYAFMVTDLDNDSGNNTLNYTVHTGSCSDADFVGFDGTLSLDITLSCDDSSCNIKDMFTQISYSNKDIQNFNFTGFRMLSDDVLINGYGFDCTVYFNIPCDYGGLNGVALGKNSIIEDKILNTLKKSSVLKFNGKKLNIPTNKLSIHYYEPTAYSTDELKKKYGYFTLSDKSPYDLWKNGDGRLRGTIIFTTGNVPQVNGDIPIEYKADFVDSCYSKYFSFKGYDFSSTTYSCTGSVRFQAVVDADNDGFDDNTGKGVGTPYDDNGNHTVAGETVEDEPNRSDYDDGILGLVEYIGDLIVYWIKAPFVSIANGFTILINSANSCFEWFGNFGNFFNNFFSFLPSPVQNCAISIISATTVSIILAMFFKR